MLIGRRDYLLWWRCWQSSGVSRAQGEAGYRACSRGPSLKPCGQQQSGRSGLCEARPVSGYSQSLPRSDEVRMSSARRRVSSDTWTSVGKAPLALLQLPITLPQKGATTRTASERPDRWRRSRPLSGLREDMSQLASSRSAANIPPARPHEELHRRRFTQIRSASIDLRTLCAHTVRTTGGSTNGMGTHHSQRHGNTH